jgi:predicted XRE-type DNA-binding protein
MATKPVSALRKASSANIGVELGTSNVFADLGLDSPDERQLRVKLAIRLNDLIQAEGLTQAAVAKRLGLVQPHVSELKNYKLSRFSSERLMHMITLLNRDIEIFIRPRAAASSSLRKTMTQQVGQVSVWAAA